MSLLMYFPVYTINVNPLMIFFKEFALMLSYLLYQHRYTNLQAYVHRCINKPI